MNDQMLLIINLILTILILILVLLGRFGPHR
jgi:hypothetical protein